MTHVSRSSVGYVKRPGAGYFNTGQSRSFHEVPWNDGRGTVYGLAFADFDGDGWPDIVAARSDAPNCIWFSTKPGERRYLSLRIDLDPSMVGAVMIDAGMPTPSGPNGAKAVFVSALEIRPLGHQAHARCGLWQVALNAIRHRVSSLNTLC
jgi:hypothetical protein